MPRPHALEKIDIVIMYRNDVLMQYKNYIIKYYRHVEDHHELEAVVQRQDGSCPNKGHPPIPVHEVLPEEVNASTAARSSIGNPRLLGTWRSLRRFQPQDGTLTPFEEEQNP